MIGSSLLKPLLPSTPEPEKPEDVPRDPTKRPVKTTERHMVGAMVGVYQTAVRALMGVSGFVAKDVSTSIGTLRVYDKRSYTAPLNVTVVVLHGLGSSALDYHPLMRAMSQHVTRVIGLDLPAHGDSTCACDTEIDGMVAAVGEVLQVLQTGSRMVLFGNSMGGFASLLLAMRTTLPIASLVLSSPAGMPMEEHELQDLKNLFAVMSRSEAKTFVERILVSPPAGWMRKVLEIAIQNQFDNADMQRLVQTAQCDIFLRPEELKTLGVKTHVYWGDEDKVLPMRHRGLWEALESPMVSVHPVKDAGHVPFLEDCPMVVDWIVQACKEVVGGKACPEDTRGV